VGEEVGGKLKGNPGAITAGAVSVNAAAVCQGVQTGQGLFDYTVRRRGIKLSDEPNPTGVVLFSAVESVPFIRVRFLLRPGFQ
jgi:hypothetical protein